MNYQNQYRNDCFSDSMVYKYVLEFGISETLINNLDLLTITIDFIMWIMLNKCI